jgi:NADP-dependent 3-hydroxy acid dehydrogenase YdfG
MFLAIFFQIFLYFGIIAVVAYWLFPLHDNIEKYFQNKVVWITGKLSQLGWIFSIFFFIGASSGIGRELAKQLARLSPSTRIILSARREQELRALADELHLDFEHCLVLPLDLELQYDCFKSKFDLVLERFGQIDILINNAGISQRSFIRDTMYKVDSRLMNINYLGTVTLSKTVLQVNRYLFILYINLLVF